MTKHYQISAALIVLIAAAGYIFPFVLSNRGSDNPISWEQLLVTLFLLAPAIALFVRKPKSLFVYTYPVVFIFLVGLAIASGDALGAGLVILLCAVLSVIYTILVFSRVIK